MLHKPNRMPAAFWILPATSNLRTTNRANFSSISFSIFYLAASG